MGVRVAGCALGRTQRETPQLRLSGDANLHRSRPCLGLDDRTLAFFLLFTLLVVQDKTFELLMLNLFPYRQRSLNLYLPRSVVHAGLGKTRHILIDRCMSLPRLYLPTPPQL